MQTYLNQREVLFKKATNVIHDPTVNQHQHIIFIIISKKLNHYRHLQLNTNSLNS